MVSAKSTVLASCAFLYAVTIVQGQVQWHEDFESVACGAVPSGWRHAAGNSDFGVDCTKSCEGTRSLREYGVCGGCWAALVASPVAPGLTCLDAFAVEFSVTNGVEPLSGCHQYRASLQLNTDPTWTSPGRALFHITEDGSILAGYEPTVGSIELDTCHVIRIEYTRVDEATVRLDYWLDGDFLAHVESPSAVHENQLVWFLWGAQEGTAWFDDITVSTCNLDGWYEDILNTWAIPSMEWKAIESEGECVITARGGVNNGSCGTQALYRPDWAGEHARVRSRVKIAGLEHGIYIGGGVLGRYMPLDGGPESCPNLPGGGTGYAAYIHINTQGPEMIRLIRLDGLHPGPNYCYKLGPVLLAEMTPELQAETWYDLALDMRGDTLRVWLDDEIVLEAQDGTYGSGMAGLYYHGSRPGIDSDPPEVWYADTAWELIPNEPPVSEAGGPYAAACAGQATTIALDGTASNDPDGDALDYAWTSDCPGGFFDDPTSATPALTLDSAGACSLSCSVTLSVDDGLATASSSADVSISDTEPPELLMPFDVTVSCDDSTDPNDAGWATATDMCDPAASVEYGDVVTAPTCASDRLQGTIQRTWSAADACGNMTSALQTIWVEKLVAELDIKPGSCPNAFIVAGQSHDGKKLDGNHAIRAGGVLPVALVGTDMFDVEDVDTSTLRLVRADCVGGEVRPVRLVYEDAASPYYGEGCECDTLRGDGLLDLSLKFDAAVVQDVLGLAEAEPRTYVPLVLTGSRFDGCEFVAEDCIWITPSRSRAGAIPR